MFPLGHNINNSAHSVLLSLPTISDVIGYEEGRADVKEKIKSGYPRFVKNPLIKTLSEKLQGKVKNKSLMLIVSTEKAANELMAFVQKGVFYAVLEGFHCLFFDDMECYQKGWKFLQHTGCGISSREAEDYLTSYETSEPIYRGDAEYRALTELHQCYHAADISDIYLTRGGMSGFYTAFKTINEIQKKQGKTIWVQLGWLYVDTTMILTKFLKNDEFIIFYDVCDLDIFYEKLKQYKGKIAGIVTETPTNPLVQTTNLEKLRNLADVLGAALVLDPTIASPHNVNILRYSDIHINSLTKYAAPFGDVICGAIALNRNSTYFSEIKSIIPKHIDKPYKRDVSRLAYQIKDYAVTIEKINKNTVKLANYLMNHPKVESVYWAYSENTNDCYKKIQNKENSPGGIITIVLKKNMPAFYDNIDLAKSPSFGTFQTLLCPFIYLAHYEYVNNETGRNFLKSINLNPELIRISVGIENIEQILEKFDKAFTFC